MDRPCLELDLRPASATAASLRAWLARGDRPFHLEIDTGMARAGVRWDDESALADVARSAGAGRGMGRGLYPFSFARTPIRRPPRSSGADSRPRSNALPRRPALIHAANSAAALQGRCYAADLVRPGIFLYGGGAGGPAPRPVAALRARVVAVRTLEAGDSVSYDATWNAPRRCTVATLGIGYADGVAARHASLADPEPRLVELGDGIAPLVGRVTMDMCMVALDDRPVSAGRRGDDLRRAGLARHSRRGPPAPSPTSC